MSENINVLIRWESEIRGVEVNVEGFPVWTNISTGHLFDSNSDGIWVDALVKFQLPFCLHLIVSSYGLRPVSNSSSSNLAIKSHAKHSSIHFQFQKWSYLQKHYSFHIFFHIGDIVDIPILVLVVGSSVYSSETAKIVQGRINYRQLSGLQLHQYFALTGTLNHCYNCRGRFILY